jgi:hypothetical protein
VLSTGRRTRGFAARLRSSSCLRRFRRSRKLWSVSDGKPRPVCRQNSVMQQIHELNLGLEQAFLF